MVDLADAGLYWVKQHGRDGWAELKPAPGADLVSLMGSLHSGAQTLIDSGRVVIVSSKDAPTPP